MKNPKISIITVCFNSVHHLEEAIRSVVNQPYPNKEYIVIDGGSTDGTLEIIKKYKDEITYFVSEPDNGISDAFNKGIKKATGNLIGICNSDDVLADDILSKVASTYEDGIDIYRLNEKIRDFETGEEFLLVPTLVFGVTPYNAQPCHMGCFITKQAYQKFGAYDVNFKYCMDVELLRRFTYKGAKYKYVNEICGYFRKGGASGSSEKKMREERRQIVLRYGGTKFDAWCYVTYFIVKQKLKTLLNLFGKNTATRIKSHAFLLKRILRN